MAILMVDTQNFLNNTEKILKKKGIIKNTPKDKPKWDYFDFAGLFENVLKDFSISRNLFYTAKIVFYKETPEKSKELINRNRVLINHLQKQGFKVIKAGKVRGHFRENEDGKIEKSFNERGVDVRIAVDMLTFTFLDKPPEDLIIASSDSDLQPAVRIIKNRNENTKLIYLGFGGYLNKGLSYTTDHTIAIRDSEITEFYKEQKPLISQ